MRHTSNTKRKLLFYTLVCSLVWSLFPIQTFALSNTFDLNNSNQNSSSNNLVDDVSPNSSHKVVVENSDTIVLSELSKNNATLIVDYGAFSLWRVSDSQSRQFQSRATVQVRDDLDSIKLRDTTINTHNAQANSAKKLSGAQSSQISGFQFWLIQFVGPIKSEWTAKLQQAGIQPVIYMPDDAYVVWLNNSQLTYVESLVGRDPAFQWSGPYQPAYRLSPALAPKNLSNSSNVTVTVQFYNTPTVQTSVAKLKGLGGRVVQQPWQVLNFENISLEVPATSLANLVSWPDVFNIEPWQPFQKLDEAQDQIVAGNVTTSGGNVVPNGSGYLNWLTSKGFPTTPSSYPVVDVVDFGIDNGSTNTAHPDFHQNGVAANPSRVAFVTNCTTEAGSNDVPGHGTIVAGVLGAYNNQSGSPYQDSNGYNIGLGVSPYGRIGNSKVFRNDNYNQDVANCGGNLNGAVAAAYTSGATITNNSWGHAANGSYDTQAQTYDALTRDASGDGSDHEMLHIFAAGNNGPDAGSLASPGTAKNVLTVGATENVRGNGVTDGNGISNASSADNIAAFSARGPASDGRAKPDIMAPGIHVQGPASQSAGYTGAAVSDQYYPASQTLYTWEDGTSIAAPAVAGAASLASNYYNRVLNPGNTASPAMLKALLLNTTRYLSNAGGTLPDPNQGWGGSNLNMLFDSSVGHSFLDEADVFTQTGQSYVEHDIISTTTKPVRVSLVWTDAPGSTTGGQALVNDLNLQVTIGGQTYKGNVFNGANSVTGGSFDSINNVENVFIPAGVSGNFTVTVTAANIAGKADPQFSMNNQDFALVIYNGVVNPNAINKLAVSTNNLKFNAASGSNSSSQQTLSLRGGSTPLSWASSISYDSGASGWLSLSSNGGVVLPASTVPLTLTASSTGLATGVYQATLDFTNKTEGSIDATVNIVLTISNSGVTNSYVYYLPYLSNQANGYSSSVTIQNIGDAPASIQTQYFNTAGNSISLEAGSCNSLVANAQCVAPDPFASGVQGTGFITSNQPLAVIVTENTPYGGSAYPIKAGAEQNLIAPLAINQNGGFDTKLTVFNVDSQPTLVTVAFYDQQGNLLPAASKTLNLAGYAAQTLDQTADDSNLPPGFYGWAQISGSTGSKLVAQILEERPDIHFVALSAAQALTSQTQAAIPAVFNHAFGPFVTGANIVNPNSTPVSVAITYYDNNGQAYPTTPFTIAAHAVVPVYHGGSASGQGVPDHGLPVGFYGSAIVTTSGGSAGLTIVVNEAGNVTSNGPVQSGTYGAYYPDNRSSDIGLPVMANSGGTDGYTTGATILNTSDVTATGNITYYNLDGTAAGSSQPFKIGPHASQPIYQGGASGLPTGFYGEAIVTQTSESAANDLVVTVNALSSSIFYSYTEVPQ